MESIVKENNKIVFHMNGEFILEYTFGKWKYIKEYPYIHGKIVPEHIIFKVFGNCKVIKLNDIEYLVEC
jgi:hypothetical protein